MKKFFCILTTLFLLFSFSACNTSDIEKNESPQGFVVTVAEFEITKNWNDDLGIDLSGMEYNHIRFYYRYVIDGFLEAEVNYDVNVQVAFYLGDEYITTVEKDFHLKGNDSTYSRGYITYTLDNFYTYNEILNLPIVKQELSSKVVKISWK